MQNPQHKDDSWLDLVIASDKPEENFDIQIEKVAKLRQKGYFKWEGKIYSIFLEFHLREINTPSKEQYSLRKKRRKYSSFDKRCAKFILDRIHVIDGFFQYGKQLESRCKSKLLTLKRLYGNGKKKYDYVSTIIQESQKLNLDFYPELRAEIQKWEKKSIEHKTKEVIKINLTEQTTSKLKHEINEARRSSSKRKRKIF